LLVDGAGGARENMARDEALLAAYRRGEIPPTWRLYTWREPAITYGRRFRLPPEGGGVTVVPRLSGGGLVPHGADITYCLVRERRPGARNYEDIVAAVAEALRAVGVEAAVWRGAPAGAADRCFASLAPYDIHWRGRKIAGCAQRRLRNALLHHGSIAAAAPAAALCRLGLWEEPRSATLTEILGRVVTAEEFAAALGEVLGVEPEYRTAAAEVAERLA
jgi:lipoate-protein ligase A